MRRKVILLAVVSWPAKRKMKALPRMLAVVNFVEVPVLDASMRGTETMEFYQSVPFRRCQATSGKGRGVTHEVQRVFLRRSILDGIFLQLKQFVKVAVEIGVSFPDLLGLVQRQPF